LRLFVRMLNKTHLELRSGGRDFSTQRLDMMEIPENVETSSQLDLTLNFDHMQVSSTDSSFLGKFYSELVS